MPKERRLITAALPYTNNVPHLGNIVGSHFPADVFARYCRLKGYDTLFIGGTDENGTASEIAAQKLGITPKELCDFFFEKHKEIYDWFEISYDNFSRTSREIHHKTSNKFLKEVHKNGFIIEKKIQQAFCKTCDRGLADRYIEGTCPECNYEEARGDQCEKCSSLLEPAKLKNPRCAVCEGDNVIFEGVNHLFLDLKKLSPKIKKWIDSNKQMRSQVKNLSLAWIRDGLKPRCITRDLHWGIKVPIKGFQELIWYVWAEAPLGYISSTKEWDKTKWKNYWKNKDTKYYCFIGKDNIPFHSIFFPGLLLAHKDYILPYNVVGLQYLNYERGKFSKSKNRGVFCENLPKLNLGPDYWRFYLAHVIPETKDTEFLWSDFQDRTNNVLVGNFGNFVNRTLTFTDKNFQGEIPKPKLIPKDKAFIKETNKVIKEILKLYEKVELREALELTLHLSDLGNKYFQENEPWNNKERSKTVVYLCVNLCKDLALLLQPVIPQSSRILLDMLNSKEDNFEHLAKITLNEGHKIKKPQILFKKLEDSDIESLKEKTSKVTEYFKKENKMEKAKPISTPEAGHYIPFKEWEKMKLRVGKIIKAELHPNADKLYVLLVDMGEGENDRQIVAGIKKGYKLEELMGKQVVVFTNLQPTEIRGIESNGMILAAGFKDTLALLQPDKKIETGARIS